MKLLSEESIKKKRRPLYAFITFSFYFLLLLINAKVFSSVDDKEKVVSKHSNNYLIIIFLSDSKNYYGFYLHLVLF